MSRELAHGCYYVTLKPKAGAPSNQEKLHGTLRVQRTGKGVIASGDLYRLRKVRELNGRIPIFPIADYRCYLAIKRILQGSTEDDSFPLEFNLNRYIENPAPPDFRIWAEEEPHAAGMFFKKPLSYLEFPHPANSYLEGEVTREGQGGLVYDLTMEWVNKFLRCATVEIDKVTRATFPRKSEGQMSWEKVFEKVDWEINVKESSSNIGNGSNGVWDETNLHSKMLQTRTGGGNPQILDEEWRYHLLCVEEIRSSQGSSFNGLMYDKGATDSNRIPREGAAVAFEPPLLSDGTPIGELPTFYLRTALHEIGHAMGLLHRDSGTGIMTITQSVVGKNIPEPKLLSFEDDQHDDEGWLRHEADIYVRPGGVAFNPDKEASDPAWAKSGLEHRKGIASRERIHPVAGLILTVSPLLDSFPVGAPVRVNVVLTNSSSKPRMSPVNLSLKSEHVRGSVVDPMGVRRTFRPLIMCTDRAEELHELKPGEKIAQSITLLRGAEGPLFPVSGKHMVTVEAIWHDDGTFKGIKGETQVTVGKSAFEDTDYKVTAQQLLKDPDTLLWLAIGAEPIPETRRCLEVPALRPHFAMAEAKRLFKEPDALKEVWELLDEGAVVSGAEIGRTLRWLSSIKDFAEDDDARQKVRDLFERMKKNAEKNAEFVDEEAKKLLLSSVGSLTK